MVTIFFFFFFFSFFLLAWVVLLLFFIRCSQQVNTNTSLARLGETYQLLRLLVWTTCSIPTIFPYHVFVHGLRCHFWPCLAESCCTVPTFFHSSLDYFYGSILCKTVRLASTVVQGHILFSVMAQGHDDLLPPRKVGRLKYHSATSVTRYLGSGLGCHIPSALWLYRSQMTGSEAWTLRRVVAL